MNLELLKAPFAEDEIEWRLAQCGKRGNTVWAQCLAYVSARAILDRLDQVCGAHNWKVSYVFVSASQGMTAGVICQLSILCGDTWITKEDGAEQTDIESFKGGISSALKRAGSAWGIGRYLYSLETGFATIVSDRNSGRYGKTKDGVEFYWAPPRLPDWALPPKPGSAAGSHAVVKPLTKADAKPISGGAHPQQPEPGDGHEDDNGYKVPFGKFMKRTLEEIDPKQLGGYVLYLEEQAHKKNQPMSPQVLDFVERASAYLAAFEQTAARAVHL